MQSFFCLRVCADTCVSSDILQGNSNTLEGRGLITPETASHFTRRSETNLILLFLARVCACQDRASEKNQSSLSSLPLTYRSPSANTALISFEILCVRPIGLPQNKLWIHFSHARDVPEAVSLRVSRREIIVTRKGKAELEGLWGRFRTVLPGQGMSRCSHPSSRTGYRTRGTQIHWQIHALPWWR